MFLPVRVSTRGYGILWDNASVTTFEDGAWSSEVGDAVDYYFMHGPDLDGVVDRYRTLTGRAPSGTAKLPSTRRKNRNLRSKRARSASPEAGTIIAPFPSPACRPTSN